MENMLKTYFITNVYHLWPDSESLLTFETGRMMTKPREHRMCTFCWNKEIGDEHLYIFKFTHPKFIPIRAKLFEAILS